MMLPSPELQKALLKSYLVKLVKIGYAKWSSRKHGVPKDREYAKKILKALYTYLRDQLIGARGNVVSIRLRTAVKAIFGDDYHGYGAQAKRILEMFFDLVGIKPVHIRTGARGTVIVLRREDAELLLKTMREIAEKAGLKLE